MANLVRPTSRESVTMERPALSNVSIDVSYQALIPHFPTTWAVFSFISGVVFVTTMRA